MASSKVFNFLSILLAVVLLFSSQVAARKLATTYPALGQPSIGTGCTSQPNKPCCPRNKPCSKVLYNPPKRACSKLYKCKPPAN